VFESVAAAHTLRPEPRVSGRFSNRTPNFINSILTRGEALTPSNPPPPPPHAQEQSTDAHIQIQIIVQMYACMSTIVISNIDTCTLMTHLDKKNLISVPANK
jgi:hypothetical protein